MRRLIKVLQYFLLAFLIIVAIDASVVFGFAYSKSKVQKADAIIVLGAAINSASAYNRALEGLRLTQEGDSNTVVVSGGKVWDPDISEAQYMRRVMVGRPGPIPDIILEDQSHTTYENIKNSKAKLPNATSVIIVTDGFHLARGVLLAKRAGFQKVYWSAPQPTYYKEAELRHYYMREMIAFISYIPKFIFY